jgi:hypothetical protein
MTQKTMQKNKLKKADIDRLKNLIVRWTKEEKDFQIRCGDVYPRSARAAQVKDCESLARVIDYLQSVENK